MEASTNNQETHSWTDRHVQLIESALRHADDVLAGAVSVSTYSILSKFTVTIGRLGYRSQGGRLSRWH